MAVAIGTWFPDFSFRLIPNKEIYTAQLERDFEIGVSSPPRLVQLKTPAMNYVGSSDRRRSQPSIPGSIGRMFGTVALETAKIHN